VGVGGQGVMQEYYPIATVGGIVTGGVTGG
jgi:hypothetical protein